MPGDVFNDSIKKYVERLRICFKGVAPLFDQIETLHGFGAYRWRYRAVPQATDVVPDPRIPAIC